MPDELYAMNRAGEYVQQPEGHSSFIPRPLPPHPAVVIDNEMANLLSKANRALGRLDGSAEILPNPDLFVAMYVRKESVLSSQIEGTQASLQDVLAYEAFHERRRMSVDVQEVVNHVRAMNLGIRRLGPLPVGTQLLREVHQQLLRNVRGKEKWPGEFRRTQNWIGPPGSDISDAVFVPPPASLVQSCMSDLETYMSSDSGTPTLIKCGLVHAQFETIHPFLDGNGRLGRLLVTLLLCKEEVLSRPLLYISAYYKQYREQYYNLLQNVRDTGDWEDWLKFFLTGVWKVSEEAFDTARRIIGLRELHRGLIAAGARSSAKALLLLDKLFYDPLISVADAAEHLNLSYPAASSLVSELERLGLLEETTGQKRNRLFRYAPYVDLLGKGTEL